MSSLFDVFTLLALLGAAGVVVWAIASDDLSE